MSAFINWIITIVAVIVGIAGLYYLLKARSKMGTKLKEAGVYLAIAVVIFLIQGVGDAGLTQALSEYAGLWAVVTLLIGMVFFTLGFKKLAETFN
jgi:hypothetical protein